MYHPYHPKPIPYHPIPIPNQDAWSTLVGSLVTSLLGLRWTFHLFAGAGTEQELHALTASPDREAPIDMVLEQIRLLACFVVLLFWVESWFCWFLNFEPVLR